MLGVGGEEIKRRGGGGVVCMERHHLLRTVHLSIMSVCVSQATEEFVLRATKKKSGLSF